MFATALLKGIMPGPGEGRGWLRVPAVAAALRVETLTRVVGVTLVAASIASCGSSGSSSSGSRFDATIGKALGGTVSGCHAFKPGEALASDIGLAGTKAYQCAGGVGAIIKPGGVALRFNAPEPAPSTLTAAHVTADVAAALSQRLGKTPRVYCGPSTNVKNGGQLHCHITFPNSKGLDLTATVHGSPGAWIANLN